MEVTQLIASLAGLTLSAVAVFAYASKRKAEERLNDDSAPKSALAADGPDRK